MSYLDQTDQLRELAAHIELRQPDLVSNTEIARGELTIEATGSDLPALAEFLKTDEQCRFATFVDLTAIDYPGDERRFCVVYHFLSMYLNQRIRLKIHVREEEIVPSIIDIYPAANWFEREVFDMFGILFSGHPDLRRILTDYGFRGHPLRKDFPTTGYTEVRYDEVEKRVVYEPVSLTQEYRQFDFMSPWEGAEYVLPGDEKGEGAK
ncbi:NADH-quinone oxidoreductase subunit C [Jannaschia sp. S6380]|uniref:NADH-quinone oxidoreductase subunit C n=1 Tax=Jannaschia sp. S6380 TaxID=2926408 RepID=UPI001FF4A756|nr:NADH-quinone oxidoreductase subunit C [Jannaschia sp. S6380]MCK0168974.1 NADH-quinone oxidoreductase subunit C [Jannaschia sp. S6380]